MRPQRASGIAARAVPKGAALPVVRVTPSTRPVRGIAGDFRPGRRSRGRGGPGIHQGEIRFDDVSFSYVPEPPVLKNALISAAPGEQVVAIVGPTSAGKTTIISLLPRFYDPDRGTIFRLIRRDSYLFSETVRDNIRYAAPGPPDAEVERVARLANAHQFILHLPQGYDTILANNGATFPRASGSF